MQPNYNVLEPRADSKAGIRQSSGYKSINLVLMGRAGVIHRHEKGGRQ